MYVTDNRSTVDWGGKVNFKGHEDTFWGDRKVLYLD